MPLDGVTFSLSVFSDAGINPPRAESLKRMMASNDRRTDRHAFFIWRYHMPSPLADRVHETLNGQPLTRDQYVGLLGQLYHFSAAAQSHLSAVVERIDDPALSRWF